MQPSHGMILIFLLARLQWNRSNTEAGEVKEESKQNSSITDNHQSAVKPTSQRFVLHRTTVVNPSVISDAAATAANANENIMKGTEMISGANSTSPRFSDGTTLSSNVPKDGTNNSTTNFHRSPTTLATFRTMGDFSGVTKSLAATPTSTVTPSNSTVTYITPGDLELPSDNSSINSTTSFPISVTLTSPTEKQDSPTPNFNPTQQTTKINYNASNPFTASPNPKDANEDKTNKEGVIAGVIVGAILGFILIGLIGYFICGKKRSDSFSHRRLYDDTRSDPVLHLDNSLGPYDTSFGGASDDKTSTAAKTEEDSAGHPSDGIPMADITPSHPSP
ncbi:mucin-15 [Manacus candei]|uniref:mucin-15 n=1 Tax=Manacus candei TaxID=415023 RepID=UPI002226A21E|nr:mucin-15 [Manacus candei]XP_051632792.1 mucin-15 [Manacus candei]